MPYQWPFHVEGHIADATGRRVDMVTIVRLLNAGNKMAEVLDKFLDYGAKARTVEGDMMADGEAARAAFRI